MALPGPAIDLVLKHEGGLVNDPQDPGGVTNFGISKRAYPDLDIVHLSRDDARSIYLRDYWRFAAISDQKLANCVMDCAVNSGLGTAIKLFQKLEGVAVDGAWGPNTENYANKVTLIDFQVARLLNYVNVVAHNPGELKFLGGWFRRTLDC
jgi:lysozyme family protein